MLLIKYKIVTSTNIQNANSIAQVSKRILKTSAVHSSRGGKTPATHQPKT